MSAWIALVSLGVLGSLGHCVGMCTPVALFLHRSLGGQGRGLAWALHAGRLTTYALLGAFVGWLGRYLFAAGTWWRGLQGVLALALALAFLYTALALWGRVPPLESLWPAAARGWRRVVQRVVTRPRGPRWLRAYGLGLLWGALPCGLVYTAALLAATVGHPALAALGMVLFGTGTAPVLAGAGWMAGRARTREGWRRAAAALMALFAVQMALRGLAAWDLVPHFRPGGFMLW